MLFPFDLVPIDSTIGMNNKHRKILETIFADPVSPAIPWADIEGVFRGYGGLIKEGQDRVSGSSGKNR